MSISLRALRKTFGELRALDDVSLEVGAGELFTLLGPSGCGKTTLLRAVAGFVVPDDGQVAIGGEVVDGVPPHRRDVGLVFQSYALFPHLSVGENVAFGLEERRLPRAEVARRVEAALAAVRLTGAGARAPGELSGGQRQRVGIARALAIEPRVLLMDEPLSNLDAQLRVTMRDEIRELQRAAGRTTLYVTHDQEEALAISDRVAVLHGGRVQQVGAPEEVYRRPANRFVAGFVGRMSFLPGERAPGLAGERPEEVELGLRPEDVALRAAGAGTEDRDLGGVWLAGTIRARSFLGPVLRVWVDCVGGVVEAELHRAEPGAWAPGSAVEVGLLPGRAHRFGRADGARRAPAGEAG
ncbi:MAG: ABC transporter ATP-binding protein [Planctomycetota bacterium]